MSDGPSNGDQKPAAPGGGFAEEVLDEQYYGGRKPGVLGRTGLLLGVLIGAAVAAFGAWVLLFDPQPETASDQPMRITADAVPYKTRPDDPGGQEISNQDKLVYDRLNRRAGEDDGVETLLTRPEQLDVPQAVTTEAEMASEAPVAPPVAPAEQQSTDTPVSEALDPVRPAETPDPAPVETPAAEPPPVVQTQPTSAAPEPVPSPPTPSVAPPPSGWSVQLVAMRSEEAALEAWGRFQADQPALLGPLQPRVVRADLGERGVFYRLRTGDWADRAPADALCGQLQAEGVDCRVTAP